MLETMPAPDPEEIFRQFGEGSDDAQPEVPPHTRIDLDFTGKRGKRYTGSFLYTVPTIADMVKIGAMKSALLPQGSAGDPTAGVLAEVICYLEVTVSHPAPMQRPKWYRPLKDRDAGPYQELYRRCLDYEARFHGEDSEAGGLEDASGEAGPLRDAADPAASVGRKIQPPAERREVLAGPAT